MNYLSVENLTKSYGEKVLFENISFGVDKGGKVAFVARNGTGKTSLFNILSGKDSPDSGRAVWRNDLRVGYLSQTPDLPSGKVIDAVLESSGDAAQAVKHYEQCLLQGAEGEALQLAMERMDQHQAWDFENRVRTILSKLGITNLDQEIGTLSGGQQKRVALARVLIGDPQFLLLDEPTNHLDMEMIEWLEEYLSAENITLFMVTHDRYFLDRVCTEIVELDQQELHRYKGNYSYFLEKRDERYQIAASSVDKARGLMRKELEWVRRQPKARGTKAKYRMDAFDDLKARASKRMEERALSPELNARRLGTKIVELHKVFKGYENLPLLKSFDYTFKRFERVGIVGKNGTGKTTLLKLITGQHEPDAGKVVIGDTVAFGHYSQQGLNLNGQKRIIEVIKDIAEYLPLTKGKKITAAQLLERFLFPRDQHYTYVHKLSGGEQKRLFLLTVLMQNPNFLILDEPTNDLDLVTLNVLEEFLQEFPGCLVVVSHDRYFIDKLVDHIFAFEEGGVIKDFPGNYTQYRAWKGQQKKEENKPKEDRKEKPKQSIRDKQRLSYKEKLEFERLTVEIEQMEARKITLAEFLNSGDTDHQKLMEAGEELGILVPSLEEKEMRWLELSELA